MPPELRSFFAGAEVPLQAFEAWCKTYEPDARVDHICYKCGDTVEYEQLRTLFEPSSSFIYQSFISKRRIAIIKFTEPLVTTLGEIWFLELSDQKPDGSQVSGFDHLELYPTTGTLRSFAKGLIDKGVPFEETVRPHHTTYDTLLMKTFKIRLEEEPLVTKITREEFV